MTNLTIFIRILLAMVLSGIIGMDRQLKKASAGLRTNMLVGLGGCLASLLAVFMLKEYNFIEPGQITRILQGVLTGLGFLGAGCIVAQKTTVVGLTSAAAIWTTAIIGSCVGLGFYSAAIIATFLVVFVLCILKFIETKWLTPEGD